MPSIFIISNLNLFCKSIGTDYIIVAITNDIVIACINIAIIDVAFASAINIAIAITINIPMVIVIAIYSLYSCVSLVLFFRVLLVIYKSSLHIDSSHAEDFRRPAEGSHYAKSQCSHASPY